VFLALQQYILEQQRGNTVIEDFQDFVCERFLPLGIPPGLQAFIVVYPVAQLKPYSVLRRIQVIGSAYPDFFGSCASDGEDSFGSFLRFEFLSRLSFVHGSIVNAPNPCAEL
jgi:hypothetical protein